MKHLTGRSGAWTEREVVEASLFERDLFGVPPRGRAAAFGSASRLEELDEDYGRDYFPKPTRPTGALEGEQFAAQWMSNRAPQNWVAREDAIYREIVSGNVPPYLWNWKEVVAKDKNPRAVYLVTPDVLAIGSNAKNVRMPMDAITAQRVADHYACLLPTAKMENQIFQQADIQLVAITKQYNWLEKDRNDAEPDRSIKGSATAGYVIHNQLIEAQLQARGYQRGQLVAGHKKEVIIGPGMDRNPGRLYFAGFHNPQRRGPGNPNGFFQLGSGPSIHPSNFADYAQGVRLVNPYMTFDGETKLISDVLKSKEHALISDGPILKPAYRTTR